jgi:hypothetical protein
VWNRLLGTDLVTLSAAKHSQFVCVEPSSWNRLGHSVCCETFCVCLCGTDLVTLSAAKHSVFVCVVVSENRINTPFPFGISSLYM